MNIFLYSIAIGVGVLALFAAWLLISHYLDEIKERQKHSKIKEALLSDPPWENPATINNSAGGRVFHMLLQRLTLIEDRSTDEHDGLSI